MTELLTAAQMRAIEHAAIESGAVTGLELMERAGRGVVDAVFEEWPELAATSHRAVVLCGPGNNGGDGFVVARLLKDAGWKVEVYLYGDAEKLPPDAKVNYASWKREGDVCKLSFPVVTDTQAEAFSDEAYRISGTALIVDALFGIGLNRNIEGLRPIIEMNDLYCAFGPELMPARHVAIDLPSGISEAGAVVPGYATCFCADLTVTFHARKVAHRNASEYCGKVVVKDIGLCAFDGP